MSLHNTPAAAAAIRGQPPGAQAFQVTHRRLPPTACLTVISSPISPAQGKVDDSHSQAHQPQTHRQTDRHRHRQTDTVTARPTSHRQTDRHRHRQTETHRQTDRQTQSQPGQPATDTQTDRQIDTDRHRHSHSQVNQHRQTDRHRHRQT